MEKVNVLEAQTRIQLQFSGGSQVVLALDDVVPGLGGGSEQRLHKNNNTCAGR